MRRQIREMRIDGSLLQAVWGDVRAFWHNPTALVTWLLVVAVAALSGPFGTMDALPLPWRFLFWAVVVTAAFFISAITYCLRVRLIAAGVRPAILVHVAALLSAVFAVSLVVQGMNLLFFSGNPEVPPFWRLFLEVLGVGIVVKVALQFGLPHLLSSTGEERELAPARAKTPVQVCPLLSRLPPRVRGPVLHVCAADHYVRVATVKGHHMMLMRFTDALKALEGRDGMQVHRSHWVSRIAATALKRDGHRVFLLLRDGERVPVSRHRARQVRRWLEG